MKPFLYFVQKHWCIPTLELALVWIVIVLLDDNKTCAPEAICKAELLKVIIPVPPNCASVPVICNIPLPVDVIVPEPVMPSLKILVPVLSKVTDPSTCNNPLTGGKLFPKETSS